MKCPLKNKYCKSQAIARAKNNNFICSGINSKPYIKKDIIKLCVKGRFCKMQAEMTRKEAIGIITTLSCVVYNEIPE
jgi:hypothetical protein